MAKVIVKISVCVDCLLAIANGDLPEDQSRAAAVRQGMENAGGQLVAGDGSVAALAWAGIDKIVA